MVAREMDSKKLALICHDLADNKKAENIVILDVRGLSGITDFFVIATGTSEPHLRAITDEVVSGVRQRHGVPTPAQDGIIPTNWIALDFFDVVVHIMMEETRHHYNLEGLWSDAARLRPGKPVQAGSK